MHQNPTHENLWLKESHLPALLRVTFNSCRGQTPRGDASSEARPHYTTQTPQTQEDQRTAPQPKTGGLARALGAPSRPPDRPEPTPREGPESIPARQTHWDFF